MNYYTSWIKPDFDLSKPIAFDTETCIPRNSKSRASTLALYGETRLWQVCQNGKTYIYDLFYMDINILKDYFKDSHLYAHNAIYDFSCPNIAGWLPKDIDCTLYMMRHSNPELDYFSLKSCLMHHELGSKTDEGSSDWSELSLSESQLKYAAQDVIKLEKLYNKIKWVKTKYPTYRLDIANLKHSLHYQLNGFKVHEPNRLAALDKALKEEDRLKMLLPNDLNVNSSKQVCEFLGTTSSAADVLADLALNGNEIAGNIQNLRKTRKKIGVLTEKFAFNRLYGIFNPSGAITGRFTCKGNGHSKASQNLQQLNYEFKTCFGFEEDNDTYLVTADFTSLEVFNIIGIMNEQKMSDLIFKGGDFHKATAAMVYSKPADEISKIERTIAKTATFAFAYGGGPVTGQIFMKQMAGINMPLDEVKKIREGWLRAYPSVAAYHARIGEIFSNKSSVIVTSPLGRPMKADQYSKAINMPCQSTGADQTKLSINLLYERIPNVKLVNTIHDEIILEVDGFEEAKRQAKILKECMDKSWLIIKPYLKEAAQQLVMDNEAEVLKINNGEILWSTHA